ncbi:hypothetical protein ZIOFF_040298 [Zingiber officinale]|uniref:Histidine-containing phosphotransfer protein n=1 Tax=Zingiber officinale TaxID=94328 RepID=A0A8J5KV17_ZINOF|nr:hypothetical protein ZIOFF_040298 [Zingiber officinale]
MLAASLDFLAALAALCLHASFPSLQWRRDKQGSSSPPPDRKDKPFGPLSPIETESSNEGRWTTDLASRGFVPALVVEMTPTEEFNSLMNWMFSEVLNIRRKFGGLYSSLFGLLDQQFQQLQMLQDASNPDFVSEVITLFCKDSEIILAELTKLLNQPVVDFQKVDAYVHQLKGSSSRCLSSLNAMEREYFHLKDKLGTMLQDRWIYKSICKALFDLFFIRLNRMECHSIPMLHLHFLVAIPVLSPREPQAALHGHGLCSIVRPRKVAVQAAQRLWQRATLHRATRVVPDAPCSRLDLPDPPPLNRYRKDPEYQRALEMLTSMCFNTTYLARNEGLFHHVEPVDEQADQVGPNGFASAPNPEDFEDAPNAVKSDFEIPPPQPLMGTGSKDPTNQPQATRIGKSPPCTMYASY